jgi:hypothetical protein
MFQRFRFAARQFVLGLTHRICLIFGYIETTDGLFTKLADLRSENQIRSIPDGHAIRTQYFKDDRLVRSDVKIVIERGFALTSATGLNAQPASQSENPTSQNPTEES